MSIAKILGGPTGSVEIVQKKIEKGAPVFFTGTRANRKPKGNPRPGEKPGEKGLYGAEGGLGRLLYLL